MKKRNTIMFILSGVAAMLLSACNGMFEGIYDVESEENVSEYGFTSLSSASDAGTVYVDASSYTRWIYINFHNLTVDSTSVSETPHGDWDLAVHRYDAKTNSGAVAATNATDFADIVAGNYQLSTDYTNDEWTTNKIVTDMSTMMDGYLSYADSYYNSLLSEWLNVDTSNMPPSYTLSGKIYIVRLADGTKAAVKLNNYMNSSAIKGYLTINYMYPVK
jgi:hypothetical protein